MAQIPTKNSLVRLKGELAGDIRYNSGKPCIHGHPSDRYVTSGQCIRCTTIQRKEWRRKKKAANLAAVKRIPQ